MKIRGPYVEDSEQFFIFRDRSAVQQDNVRTLLRLLIEKINLNPSNYNTMSLQIGRASDLLKQGVDIETIKWLRRWKLNAVYKYLRHL